MANLVNAICNDIRVKVKSNLPNHNTITYGQLTSRQILGDVWDCVKQPIFNCVKLTVQVPTHGFILNDRNER